MPKLVKFQLEETGAEGLHSSPPIEWSHDPPPTKFAAALWGEISKLKSQRFAYLQNRQQDMAAGRTK